MRLGKKAWVIIGTVVLAIALGFMVSLYTETSAEHRQLEDRLATAEGRLPALRTEKESLESQRSQVQSSLDASRAKFPREVESIEYDEGLCATARATNVQILRITASQPSERAAGGVDYSVAAFTIVIRGDVGNILDFVHALRTGTEFEFPWSAEVTGLNIDYGSRQASMGIHIYGYK